MRDGRPGEVLVDHVLVEADRLEDLGAAVALDRGDAHLGHHLDDALADRLDVVLDRVLLVDAGQQALAAHVVERLEGEVGIDRARRRSRSAARSDAPRAARRSRARGPTRVRVPSRIR